jgi:hypothetical protein
MSDNKTRSRLLSSSASVVGRFVGEDRWTFIDGEKTPESKKLNIMSLNFCEPERGKQQQIFEIGRDERRKFFLKLEKRK